MYIPNHFSEKDPAKLAAIMRQFSFALLVSQEHGAPLASHLPLLVNDDGSLTGHMARANSQWRSAESQRVMAVFSGPHAYISPTWYDAPNTVPTWNYVAVHAYGIFRAIHDPAETLRILERTVAAYEQPRENPWHFDAASDYYVQLAKNVVAFRIDVDSVEGKLKLSQNQPPARREKVIDALEKSQQTENLAVAEWMKRFDGQIH